MDCSRLVEISVKSFWGGGDMPAWQSPISVESSMKSVWGMNQKPACQEVVKYQFGEGIGFSGVKFGKTFI